MTLKSPRGILSVAAVAGVALASVVYTGISMADGTAPESPPKPGPTQTLDTAGMSLEEIARAASGSPGAVIPPCPDAETVTALKKAGIDFGPCDPVYVIGEEMIMETPSPGGGEPEGESCIGSPGPRGMEVGFELPCGVGADVIKTDYYEQGKANCVDVTFIPEKGAEERVKTFCGTPGDETDSHTGEEHSDDHTHTEADD